MDYETARRLLIDQGLNTDQQQDALLTRLKQGIPPVPGQITSILLALKIAFEALKELPQIDRELAGALYILATESRQLYENGRRAGASWPPLLDEDLFRIYLAVRSIFTGTWQG